MSSDEVKEVVTELGKYYLIRSKYFPEPFKLFVTEIGMGGLLQDAEGFLKFRYVTHYEIEEIESCTETLDQKGL